KADGTITADGKVVAKFVENRVQDDQGKTVITVGADGAVTVAPPEGADAANVTRKALKFNANDELVADDGGKIVAADDGTLTLASGRNPAEKAPVKVEGYKPNGKRELELLIVALMMPGKVTTTGPVSVPPAVKKP